MRKPKTKLSAAQKAAQKKNLAAARAATHKRVLKEHAQMRRWEKSGMSPKAAAAKESHIYQAEQKKKKAEAAKKHAEAEKARIKRERQAAWKVYYKQAMAGKTAPFRFKASQARGKKRKLTPDGVACCTIEALAASLRLQGGLVTGEDVLALYWRLAATPDEGVWVHDALAEAAWAGFAGYRPHFRRTGIVVPGVILSYDSWWGLAPHAVTACEQGVISWRELYDLPEPPDEAWAVEWERL